MGIQIDGVISRFYNRRHRHKVFVKCKGHCEIGLFSAIANVSISFRNNEHLLNLDPKSPISHGQTRQIPLRKLLGFLTIFSST